MIDLKQIKDINDTYSKHTLSLYLQVDPSYIENQSQTPAWTIWLKNELSNIQSSLMEKDLTSLWNDISKRLDKHLSTYDISGRTLVIFMDEENEYVEELPFAMKNRSHFGQPFVSPLLWAIDEYQQYLIVMVDQQKASFRKAYLGNLETQSEITIDLGYDWGEKTLMPASGGDGQALRQGNNREAFEDMIGEHVERFYKDIADEIKSIYDDESSLRVILAGDERSAHAVQKHLHESVNNHVVDILSIPMNASEKDIMERISQVAYNYERNYELDLIKQIKNSAYDNGRGLLGRDELKKAMEMQQVEMIVMPFSLLQTDPDYAHQLAMWALENNSRIEFVHGLAADSLKEIVDVAAQLYYSIETA